MFCIFLKQQFNFTSIFFWLLQGPRKDFGYLMDYSSAFKSDHWSLMDEQAVISSTGLRKRQLRFMWHHLCGRGHGNSPIRSEVQLHYAMKYLNTYPTARNIPDETGMDFKGFGWYHRDIKARIDFLANHDIIDEIFEVRCSCCPKDKLIHLPNLKQMLSSIFIFVCSIAGPNVYWITTE